MWCIGPSGGQNDEYSGIFLLIIIILMPSILHYCSSVLNL